MEMALINTSTDFSIIQSENMSAEKTKRSILGPRGRRRLGLAKGENYKDPGGDRGGYIGTQRRFFCALKSATLWIC